MEIRFTKTAQRRYEVLVRRDDGVLIDVPSFDRPARLPHDIAHFVVESELGLGHGFYGLLAAGVVFPQMKVVAGRLRPHAAQRSRSVLREAGQMPTEAEALVGLISGIANEGLEKDWTAVCRILNAAWKPRRSQRGPLGHDEVRRVCHTLRSVEQQWQELPIGESLTVTWPDKRLSRNSK